MVQSIHAVLRNALQCAVREEVLPRNVAKLVPVSVPKYKVNRGLTVANARRVLKVASGKRLDALYVLLRPGALPRPAPGRTARPPLVRCRLRRRDGRSGPDAPAGRRRAAPRPAQDRRFRANGPASPICVKALRDHAELQADERANAGGNWEDHGLVFPSRLGTPMEPDNLRRSCGRISKSAGITNVRFHDTRHTCVSLLLDLKVPPHIVREIVGHSDMEVTMTIYAHSSLDEKRRAFRALGDILA